MNKTPVWIDTDCGVDDAIALLAALKLPSIEIVGVSSVCGNVEEDKTYRNCRNILAMANHKEIPVYHGAKKPLNRELVTAKKVHGENGLGDIIIEDSNAPHQELLAWEALYEAAKKYPNELVVVPIGPLTNIAIALAQYPDLEQLIKKIVLMAGAVVGGNRTPSAEFNIFVDPQAAQNVFKSPIEKVMFGLDVTHKSSISQEVIERIAQSTSSVGEYVSKSIRSTLKFYKEFGFHDGICLHDACPIIYLEHPELFTGVKCGVYVETQGELTMGKTCCDAFSDFKFDKRDTTVILDVEQPRFSDIIESILKNY